MRVICALLAVALLGATPPSSPSAIPAGDRLPQLLGAWTCRNGANLVSTLTFAQDQDAIVATERSAPSDAGTFVDTQRYRFDAASNVWHVEGRRFYAGFSGSAPPWTGAEWNITGTTSIDFAAGAPSKPVRREIRYVRTADGLLYRGSPDEGPARVNGVVCALGNSIPAAGLCPASTVPPMTLRAAEPGMTYGEQGMVSVTVSLDATSHVVGTSIAMSTNPSLNRVAEQAARNSTYRTEFRDCRPVPSQYLFSVQAR